MNNIELFKNKKAYQDASYFTGHLLIVIRGETFRRAKYYYSRIDKVLIKSGIFTEYVQIYCIKSLIKHVIQPIKEIHPNLKISVQFLVYPNIKNSKLVKLISEYCECKITHLSKREDNQISTFKKCINEGIKNNVDGLLVIRPDLAWIQDFNPRNFVIQ